MFFTLTTGHLEKSSLLDFQVNKTIVSESCHIKTILFLLQLTKTVGKVKIRKSKKINYLDYQPKDKSAELDYTSMYK